MRDELDATSELTSGLKDRGEQSSIKGGSDVAGMIPRIRTTVWVGVVNVMGVHEADEKR